MVSVRPHHHRHHHAPPFGGDAGGGTPGGHPPSPPNLGGRLNLLLSYAGWQSDPWVDHLPRLLEPLGVISHRAGTGREANAVITSTPIHIAVVDLGLPIDDSGPEAEEGGPRLLELLARQASPPPTVVIKRSRGHRDDLREINAALRLGAFAVVDRPRKLDDLNLMLEVLRRCLARHYHGMWPGSLSF